MVAAKSARSRVSWATGAILPAASTPTTATSGGRPDRFQPRRMATTEDRATSPDPGQRLVGWATVPPSPGCWTDTNIVVSVELK